jgi:excisionase family DNA binding protein
MTRRLTAGMPPKHTPARGEETAPAVPCAATLPHELLGPQHRASVIGPDVLATVVAAVAAALAPRTPALTAAELESQDEGKDLLTVAEAAAVLRCSRETIRRQAESGELPCIVVSRGVRKKSRRFNAHMIHALAAHSGTEADLGEIARQWLAAQAGGERRHAGEAYARPGAPRTNPPGMRATA